MLRSAAAKEEQNSTPLPVEVLKQTQYFSKTWQRGQNWRLEQGEESASAHLLSRRQGEDL